MSGKPDLVSPSSNQELPPQSSPTNGKENKTRRPGPDHGPVISETINCLNQIAGTSYRPTTKATVKHIRARLAEGFTIDDLILVVKHKWSDWRDDSKMLQYFRPETLFGSKFESYLEVAKRNDNGTQATEDPGWRKRTFINV